MSADAKKSRVISLGANVKDVGNTSTTAANMTNGLLCGEVAQYAINSIGGQGFTGLYALLGKYRVTVVLKGPPLCRADGSVLPTLSVVLPTVLSESGSFAASKTISGPGLVGYITLTDRTGGPAAAPIDRSTSGARHEVQPVAGLAAASLAGACSGCGVRSAARRAAHGHARANRSAREVRPQLRQGGRIARLFDLGHPSDQVPFVTQGDYSGAQLHTAWRATDRLRLSGGLWQRRIGNAADRLNYRSWQLAAASCQLDVTALLSGGVTRLSCGGLVLWRADGDHPHRHL